MEAPLATARMYAWCSVICQMAHMKRVSHAVPSASAPSLGLAAAGFLRAWECQEWWGRHGKAAWKWTPEALGSVLHLRWLQTNMQLMHEWEHWAGGQSAQDMVQACSYTPSQALGKQVGG